MHHLPLPLDHLHYKIPQEGGKGLRPVGVRPSPPVAAMATILVRSSRFDPQEGMGTTLLHTLDPAAMACRIRGALSHLAASQACTGQV